MLDPSGGATLREGLRDCPHCGEPTMANRLPDGSLVCSCPAMRQLAAGSLPVSA